MTAHYHAVVWIDHHEARIIHFSADASEETIVHPAHPPRHLHHTVGSAAGTHLAGEPEFYRRVASALAEAQEILVAGPSTAKTEFVKYLHRHAPPLLDRVVGVETVAPVTDHRLLAEARDFFIKADRMRSQRG